MEEAVAGALVASAHPTDAAAREAAYRQLHSLAAREAAFLPSLLAVAAAKGRDHTVRLLALTYLKNLIQRFWASGQSLFTEEKKSFVRGGLLDLIAEEDIKLARQLALCISAIVESDFPLFWPDFFTKLSQAIKSRQDSPLFTLRGFLTLHYALKRIAANKQEQVQRALTQAAPELAQFVGAAWLPSASHVISSLSAYASSPSEDKRVALQKETAQAELCKLCLKIECLLSIHLLKAKQADVPSQLLPKILDMCKAFAAARVSTPPNPLSEYVEGYLRHIAKFLLRVQEKAQKTFAPFTQPFLQFCLGLLLQTVPSAPPNALPDQFVVHCMAFVRLVVESARKEDENAAVTQIASLFTKELIENVVKALVLYYFLATREDLIEWEEEPENYFNEEIRCAWTDRRRACAEILLNSLVLKYPGYACPVIYQLFKDFIEMEKSKGGQLTDDEVRRKDAIYFAFAISSDTLSYHKYVTISTFDVLLREQFVNDVKNPDPRYKLVRRRVAQIIENWSREIHKAPSIVPMVYQFLVTLMGDRDVVVRLASTISFKIVIDDINFSPELLEPYLEQVIQSIFKIAADISDSETNIQIVQIISVLILSMKERVRPYTSSMLKCMAHLWESSKHNQLQKAEIIRTLVSLVRSLGSKASEYFDFLIPVLQQNVDVSSDDSLAVLEDGLRLWMTMLRYVPFTPDMLKLYPKIIPILHRTVQEESEVLEIVLSIIEGYVLIGGPEFLKAHAKQVLGVVDVMMNQQSLDTEQHILSCRIIDTLLQMYPKDFVPMMENIFERILFLSFAEPAESEKEFLGTFNDTALFYFAALTRLLVTNPEFFVQFIRNNGQKPPFASQNAILLAQWADRLIVKLGQMVVHPIASAPMDLIDQIVYLRRLFIVGLGILMSLSVTLPGDEGTALLARLPTMVNFCAGLTVEYLTHSAKSGYIPITNKDDQLEVQRSKLREVDPVHNTPIEKFFAAKLEELGKARPNELTRERLLQMLSPAILNQLTALLQPPTTPQQ